MSDSELVSGVSEILEVDPETYQQRVATDGEVLREEVATGTFDNPQAIVGLEYEFYAVKGPDATDRWGDHGGGAACSLARLPRRLLRYVGFEKELGLHNAELCTSPQPLSEPGLRAQEAQVQAQLVAARQPLDTEGIQLVSDGLWTIPPFGETARDYLTDSVEQDGIRIASNMSDSARYHAMANTDSSARMELDAPHVSIEADTVMIESLATSIQPHYQIPHASDLPLFHSYALRIAGPLLALAVNSPLFPPDLYDEGVDPQTILEDGHAEHRISVFETALNPEAGPGKVRFPADLDSVDAAIDRIVDDETMVPMPVSPGERFDDSFAHLRQKHGTYWRWVRPVFGGASRSAANARVEFRPLPGQPTVRDTIALQVAFSGLMTGLSRLDHPVIELDWETAHENFYAAAHEGLDADLEWITSDGAETTEIPELYEDLFDVIETGLRAHGLGTKAIDSYLMGLEERVEAGVTPADWKVTEVETRLDSGESFEDAVRGMQQTYIRKQADADLEETFASWLY